MKLTLQGFRNVVASFAIAFLCLVGAAVASAQPNLPPTWVFARNYAGWNIIGQQANTYTFNGAACNYVPANNGNTPSFFVFSGYNASVRVYYPVAIYDANTANNEIVTPSSTSQTSSSCGFSGSMAHQHVSFTLSSGTAGLQEAIMTQQQSTPIFSVILDKYWYSEVAGLPGTPSASSIIAAVAGNADVGIVDTTTMPWTYYAWNGSAYAQAAESTAKTSTAATPGAVTSVLGTWTTTNASYSNGSDSVRGVRGLATIPAGTTVAAGYIYGTQGKYVLAGTSAGTAWQFGLLGQLDISAATLTSGSHIGSIWGDAGATGPAVSCTFCDGLVLTNTTATTFNSVIYGYSKAGYFADLSNNGSAFINGSTATGGSVTGYLKIKINGTDAYIAYKGTPGT